MAVPPTDSVQVPERDVSFHTFTLQVKKYLLHLCGFQVRLEELEEHFFL